jgi:predicted RNA methylase
MYTLHEDEAEQHYLGQFIPLHYHHNMLMDKNRMDNFKAAIEFCVHEGAKVLELGGGTGVLSCLAAAKADKVWCVEFNPVLVAESKRLLAMNTNGHKVEVIHANAFEYLPPEPVDVVICEMVHVAMLREKQIEMIESFKARYRARFGDKLPVFIPTAVIMAVQPLQQDYDFSGYHAPIIQFQRVHAEHPRAIELATPQTYSILDLTQPTSSDIAWEGTFTLAQDGTVNALRFFTKNVLAIDAEHASTIDWNIDYLVLPLLQPVSAKAGDTLQVSFRYRTGGSIRSLENSIRATLRTSSAQQ